VGQLVYRYSEVFAVKILLTSMMNEAGGGGSRCWVKPRAVDPQLERRRPVSTLGSLSSEVACG
jgi:hypothetical protein